MKKRILFVNEYLDGGGAEKVLRSLVNNLDQDRFDITVQTIEYHDPEGLLAPGIHYKAINYAKSHWGRKINQLFFRLCAELKLVYPLYMKGGYDIEVAYMETSPTKLIAQSTNDKAVKIAWVHCDAVNKHLNTPKTKKQYDKFDKVICVSNEARESFVKEFKGEIIPDVIYNVIDEEEIFRKAEEAAVGGWDTGAVNLVSVGRISHEKGYDRLIRVCASVAGTGRRFHLYLLGDGPERKHVEEMINEFDLSGTVTLMGFCDNPYPYMKAADCIVSPSRTEALSTVILESLILGKAIVTTECSGMKELLGDSEYGLVVDNSEEGLFRGLCSMIDQRDLREIYMQKADNRGRQYYKNSILNETQQYFETIRRQ